MGSPDPGPGTVTRDTVGAADWPDAPQTVPAPDHVIDVVLGDDTDEAHAITLECGTVGCWERLVVPPEEPAGTAGRLVTAAAGPWNTPSAGRVPAQVEGGAGQESAGEWNG
ncbi:DUF5994 family protein [Streptomyces sp. NBC_00631]|uniref:DUF5994 family protein n=1 Tax=Streptomyces sp. NBC_00631 TaxID=2975793 RepID=UPI0030DDE97A